MVFVHALFFTKNFFLIVLLLSDALIFYYQPFEFINTVG